VVSSSDRAMTSGSPLEEFANLPTEKQAPTASTPASTAPIYRGRRTGMATWKADGRFGGRRS